MEFVYELIDRNKNRLYSDKKGAARIYARREVLDALEDLKDCVKGIKISALKDEREATVAAEKIILFCSNKTNELFCSNETNKKDMQKISFFFAGVDRLLYDSPIGINHFRKTGDITYRTHRGGEWKHFRGEHLDKLVSKHESVAGNSSRSEEAQPALPQPGAKGKEKAALPTQDYGPTDLSLLSGRNELPASRPMPYGPMLGGNAANRESLQIWHGVRIIDASSYQTGEILLSQLLRKNIYQVGRGRDKIDESLPKVDEYFQDRIDITALKASSALAEETAKKFIRFCLITAGPTSRQRMNVIRGYDVLVREHFPFKIDYSSPNPAHATYQASPNGEKKDYYFDDQLNEIEDPRKKIQRYKIVASLQYELFKESDGEQRSKLATALKSTLEASVPDAVQVRWLSEVNEYLQRKIALKSHPLSVGELGTRQRSPQDAHNELSLLTEEAQGEHATARDDDAIRDISPESSNVSRPTSASSVISPTKGAIPREKSPNGGAQAAPPGKSRSGGRPYQNAPFESQIPVPAPTRFDNDGIYRIINNEIKNFQQDSLDKNREAREFLGNENVWDRKSLEACVKKQLRDFTKASRETGYNPFYIDKLYALTKFFCDPGVNSPSDLADGVKAADYICDKVVTTDEIDDPWRMSCFMMHRVKIAEQENRIVDAQSFRIWAGKLVGQDGVPERNRWNVNMEIAKDKKIGCGSFPSIEMAVFSG